VTFLAAGDIILSRNVALAIQSEKNPDYPFLGMEDILKSTDFNFANLESPFSVPTPKSGGGIIGGHSLIFGAPEYYITSLPDFNFKILNLANNHAFDQGLDGLRFTNKLL